MNQSRKTNLIHSDNAIHTQYFGDVTVDFILEAINEWGELLKENPSIFFLIFDYSNANMNKLDIQDIKMIALKTASLVEICGDLKMVAVMPKESDFRLASIWSAFTATDDSAVSYENIVIFRDISEAKYYIEERLTPL